jgi:NAD(P)-dependent dehydrogenase (short-subunit alcohol dehydrogenase family)
MTEQSDNRFDLTGRIALVTGGGGLLGPRHGAALATLGARVVLADIDLSRATQAADLCRKASGARQDRVIARQLDVSSADSIAALHDSLDKDTGAVDILVNNAAVDPKVRSDGDLAETGRVEHFPRAEWDRQIAIGLTGAFLCAQVFGTTMAARGHGVILNIASDLSVIAPDQRLYRQPGVADDRQPVKPVTYSVVKTGLIGLTRYLASYWADSGVRVNALSPGGVYTNQPDDFVQRLSALIPMGRMARIDEYQAAVQFLCSDASSYMTGQNIVIDGGRSIL